MPDIDCNNKAYVIAAAVGAIGGGLLVALGAKAISNIVPRMKEKMAGCCP